MDTIHTLTLVVSTSVDAATTIPGLNVLKDIAGAIRGVLVTVGLIAFLVSAIGWGFTKGTSPQIAGRFMTGMIVAIGGVLLGTAAPTIIDWAQGLGNAVQ